MARRHALAGGVLVLVSLFVVGPALAEYLGPDRHVVRVVHERSPANDYWTCTNRLPPPGVSGTCILQNPANPCPDAGGHHPSREQQSAWCLWGTNYQDWAGCGCTAAYTTRTVETDLPEAGIAAELQGCATVNGWCSAAAVLHLTGSEPVAGESILAIEGTRNGESFACGGAACDVMLLEGGNAFTYWAISSFGDSSRMGEGDALMDSVPPILSADVAGTPGDNDWWVSSVTLTAGASDPEPGSGLAALEVMFAGIWDSYAGPVSIGEGIHDLHVRAFDVVGHVAEAAYGLRIDTTPSECILDGPDGGWVAGVVTVTGRNRDSGSGPGLVEVGLDGGSAWSSQSPHADGSWSLAWDTRGGPDGANIILAQCWDLAGNGSPSSPRSAPVDNSPPWIEIPERWVQGHAAALTIEDHGSGLAGVRIRIDGGALGSSTQIYDGSTSFPTSLFWDGTLDGDSAPPGEFVVIVEAWDLVGNRGEAGSVVVVPLPQPAHTQVSPAAVWRASTATLVPRAVTASSSPTSRLTTPYMPGRLSSATPRAPRVVPLAPAMDTASEVGNAPAEVPPGKGALWGVAALAAVAAATAYALSRKEERRKQTEAELRQAAEAAGRAATIRAAAEEARTDLAAAGSVHAVAGSKHRAQVRPVASTHEPDAGELAHHQAMEDKMRRLDEQAALQEQSLRQEGRQAVSEARQRLLDEAARARQARAGDSQGFLGSPRPATVSLDEWRGIAADERAGLAEQSERNRLAGLRAAAATIGAGLVELTRRPKRNAERAEEEARQWQESRSAAPIVHRGEFTYEDRAEIVAWAERERARWNAEVIALSASPPVNFRLANADLGVADQSEGLAEWRAWQARVRGLTELPPLQFGSLLSGRSGTGLGTEQLAALRALLLQPTNTAYRPTLSTWRLAGEVTGQGLEAVAVNLLDITPWQRDMVGGVGLAETRSVGPVAMLVFDMTYYNRVTDTENEYWSGYHAAARGFADLGSAYDLVDEHGGRTYDGRNFARYLEDSLEGRTRQNGSLLYSSGRWWDPQVRWAFTHRAAAVAAQDMGWRVIAGYRMAELLGEDVAFFINDQESTWWTYQQALMDAGVLHYETSQERASRHRESVRTSILEANPSLASDDERLAKLVEGVVDQFAYVPYPDANTLDGVVQIARTINGFGNQYSFNPRPEDMFEFARDSGVGGYNLGPDPGEIVLPRYAWWVYDHANTWAAMAEEGSPEAAAGAQEYRDHYRSLVILQNTAGGVAGSSCASFYWTETDPQHFRNFGTQPVGSL